MLIHCNLKFRPEYIWYLTDNEAFTNRRLEVNDCPVCGQKLARLVETRITDNKVFESLAQRRKAWQLIHKLTPEISYTDKDCKVENKSLFGWRYGENTERTQKDGTVTTTQKAVDFYGNKSVVKESTVTAVCNNIIESAGTPYS